MKSDIQISQEILSIAMSVPRFIADVFVRWSCHCQYLEVEAYKGGWKGGNPDFLSYYYVSSKAYLNRTGQNPEATLNQLRSWLATQCGWEAE